MLLLAADTSGRNGSLALAQGNADGSCDVLEVISLEGGAFSAQLIPQLVSLLHKHQRTKEEIGGFAVVSGPGSFTGLRVGLAAMIALAEVFAKPIAMVSLLQAVAQTSGTQGVVAALLDAGRNEIYLGRYRIDPSKAEMIEEKLIQQSELNSMLGDEFITLNQNIAEAAAARGLKIKTVAMPQSDTIARLGWTKILRGEIADLETIDANYIRRSDAEIFSKSSS